MKFSNQTEEAILALKETCSTREAANRLNVAISTVQSWVETGALDAWKTPGGHRRVQISSIENLLKIGKRKTNENPASIKSDSLDLPRVLIIENDLTSIAKYTSLFNEWQLPALIYFCDNGYEAMLRIGHEVPHLIILDLSAPGMDGLLMLQTICQFSVTTSIQIIAMAKHGDFDIIGQSSLAPNVLLLMKPIGTEQLRSLIYNAIDLHRKTLQV